MTRVVSLKPLPSAIIVPRGGIEPLRMSAYTGRAIGAADDGPGAARQLRKLLRTLIAIRKEGRKA